MPSASVCSADAVLRLSVDGAAIHPHPPKKKEGKARRAKRKQKIVSGESWMIALRIFAPVKTDIHISRLRSVALNIKAMAVARACFPIRI